MISSHTGNGIPVQSHSLLMSNPNLESHEAHTPRMLSTLCSAEIHNIMGMVTPSNKTLSPLWLLLTSQAWFSCWSPWDLKLYLQLYSLYSSGASIPSCKTQYPAHVNRFSADQSWVQSNQISKPLKVKVQKPLLTWKFNEKRSLLGRGLLFTFC